MSIFQDQYSHNRRLIYDLAQNQYGDESVQENRELLRDISLEEMKLMSCNPSHFNRTVSSFSETAAKI